MSLVALSYRPLQLQSCGYFLPRTLFCSCLRFKRTDLSSTRSCTFNQFASDPILIFFPGSCFWRFRQLLEAAKTLNRNMNWELSLLRSERETRKFEKGFWCLWTKAKPISSCNGGMLKFWNLMIIMNNFIVFRLHWSFGWEWKDWLF